MALTSSDSDSAESQRIVFYGKTYFAADISRITWTPSVAIKTLACGDQHTLMAAGDGSVWSMGANDWGQLGLGHNTRVSEPQIIPGLSGPLGTLSGCGSNEEQQLACEKTGTFYSPIESPHKLVAATYIDAGAEHAIAICDGKLQSWGSNDFGQLGRPRKQSQFGPVQVKFKRKSRVQAAACGVYHTAAALDDGSCWTWGEADSGKLGLDTESDQSKPCHVSTLTLSSPFILSAGAQNTLICSDGALLASGDNSSGQLALARTVQAVSSFTQVNTAFKAMGLSCGEEHIAVYDGSRVLTAGSSRYGMLGHKKAIDDVFELTPIDVDDELAAAEVVAFGCGGCHTVVCFKAALPASGDIQDKEQEAEEEKNEKDEEQQHSAEEQAINHVQEHSASGCEEDSAAGRSWTDSSDDDVIAAASPAASPAADFLPPAASTPKSVSPQPGIGSAARENRRRSKVQRLPPIGRRLLQASQRHSALIPGLQPPGDVMPLPALGARVKEQGDDASARTADTAGKTSKEEQEQNQEQAPARAVRVAEREQAKDSEDDEETDDSDDDDDSVGIEDGDGDGLCPIDDFDVGAADAEASPLSLPPPAPVAPEKKKKAKSSRMCVVS